MVEEKMQYPPVSELQRPEEIEYPLPGNKVEVYVHKVYGCCPIVVEGDKLDFNISLNLDECKISSELPMYLGRGKPLICSVLLTSVYHYHVAMSSGVSAVDLGIAKSGEDGYVMCSAHGPPTCEAQVIFRLHPVPLEKCGLDELYEYLAKVGHINVPSYFLEKFATDETREARKKKIEEWVKAGKPKFWEGWRNPPCQPRHKEEVGK